MVKRGSISWLVPSAMTAACVALTAFAGFAFGRDVLLLTAFVMPLPLAVFWLSWNVDALERWSST